MALAEGLARARGATTIGLNVFWHNHVARRLSTTRGHTEAELVVHKDLQ